MINRFTKSARKNYHRQYRRSLFLTILSVAVGISHWSYWATAQAANWQVRSSQDIKITVEAASKIRENFDATRFFGFNLNYFAFQRQLWDRQHKQVKPIVVDHLKKHFAGSRYRYPGGMVANGFDWQGSIGAYESRVSHQNLYGSTSARAAFGVDEYAKFLQQVSGNSWYVLNLVGTDAQRPWTRGDLNQVSARNAKLADYLSEGGVFGDGPHFYQLGNELDRSKYEWTHDEYVERSKASVEAISKTDNKARFIAFLREFKYRYRDKKRGMSHHADLMADVLRELPQITDYSLMQYYDGLREDGKIWDVGFWLRKTRESINLYKGVRDGQLPSIWITEHARQPSSDQAGTDNSRHVTSGLGGAISTADYLTAMMQVPPVKGMFWHALNAGPWQLFDGSVKHNDLRPRPIFWSQSLLRQAAGDTVFGTVTHSTNQSGYKGGYDIRAVAFGHSDDDRRISLWVINRSQQDRTAILKLAHWKNKKLMLTHRYLGGEPGRDADDIELEPQLIDEPQSRSVTVSASGQMNVDIPASSVSTLELYLD